MHRRFGESSPTTRAVNLCKRVDSMIGISANNRVYSELVRSVTTRITPSTWGFVGGYATIRADSNRTTLVVEHAVFSHAEITRFLTRVREQKDVYGEIGITTLLHQVSELDEQ